MNHKSIIKLFSLVLLVFGASKSALAMEKEPHNIVAAAEHKDIEAVKRFLDQGVSPDATDPADEHGCRPLGWAVANDDVDMAKLLLARGANIDCANKLGQVPLLIATTRGNVNMVCLLVEKGANINYTDEVNIPSLNYACELYSKAKHNEDEQLKGGDWRRKCYTGYEVLPPSASFYSIIKKLLKHKADVAIADRNGNTPLHIAAWGSTGKLELIALLLDHGAEINRKNNKGETVLMISCHDLERTQYLIRHGADINLKDSEGKTAQHRACEWNYSSVAHYLIDVGAAVNDADNKGNTPLIYACKHQDEKAIDIVRTLLRRGACVNCEDVHGYTPLMLSCSYSHTSFGRDDSDDKYTPSYDLAVMEELLKYKAHVNHKNKQGESVLGVAVRYCHFDYAAIEELIKNGAKINGENFLEQICSKGYDVGLVETLLAYGADPNFYKWTSSPLSTALQKRADEKIIRALLKAGAEVSDEDIAKAPYGFTHDIIALLSEAKAQQEALRKAKMAAYFKEDVMKRHMLIFDKKDESSPQAQALLASQSSVANQALSPLLNNSFVLYRDKAFASENKALAAHKQPLIVQAESNQTPSHEQKPSWFARTITSLFSAWSDLSDATDFDEKNNG